MITITEIELKLARLEKEEHDRLGEMLKNERCDSIGVNWQGGRVNGIRLALEMIREESGFQYR